MYAYLCIGLRYKVWVLMWVSVKKRWRIVFSSVSRVTFSIGVVESHVKRSDSREAQVDPRPLGSWSVACWLLLLRPNSTRRADTLYLRDLAICITVQLLASTVSVSVGVFLLCPQEGREVSWLQPSTPTPRRGTPPWGPWCSTSSAWCRTPSWASFTGGSTMGSSRTRTMK